MFVFFHKKKFNWFNQNWSFYNGRLKIEFYHSSLLSNAAERLMQMMVFHTLLSTICHRILSFKIFLTTKSYFFSILVAYQKKNNLEYNNTLSQSSDII